MLSFVMSWMWRWLALVLLTAATSGSANPLPSTTVLPSDLRVDESPLTDHVDKEVQALEAAARPSSRENDAPAQRAKVPETREAKLLATDRESKLMERDRESRHKTLDRGASELAWKNWLQSPESRDPGAPPRRITAKSVFIAPINCPEGRKIGEGCVSVHQVGKEAHERYILEQLNGWGVQSGGGVQYDYDEATGDGPLQLNLPLGPAFAASSSQNIITTVPANENKDGNRLSDAELEAEFERLKLELERLAPMSSDGGPAPDKPKRDHQLDQGQKEIIFGNVSEDPYANLTQAEPTTERRNATGTDRTQSDEPTSQRTETPPKPEIEYADIGDAVKLISRYADVTTDDSFKGERRRTPDEGPLGTRTRQQHRKPATIYAPSIYADRLATHLAYPRPPPDYPFRHVQDYWTHPERFLGPYAHANPRRHHHAYPRRPALRTDQSDLYQLLAMRRWYSGDAVADR